MSTEALPVPQSVSSAPAPARLRASSRRAWRERLVEGVITTVAFSGLAALLLIILFVGQEALPLATDAEVAREASLSKLFLPQVLREGRPPAFMWQPVSDHPRLSLAPLVAGTLKVTLIAVLVAIPVGLLAALFTAEFASRRLRELLKPLVELLAAVPSVVLGSFALMVLAGFAQEVLGMRHRLSALVAGLGMALAIVPVVFTLAEDALTSVPRAWREASLALGATRWETAWRVVLPAAAPGVLAACVLAVGRALGETMIVLMASGNAALLTWSPGDSTRSMSATIAAEMGEVVVGSAHWSVLFFIGVLLFAWTLLLNVVAGRFVARATRKLGGAA